LYPGSSSISLLDIHPAAGIIALICPQSAPEYFMGTIESAEQTKPLRRSDYRGVVRELIFPPIDFSFDDERILAILRLDPELSVLSDVVTQDHPRDTVVDRFHKVVVTALLSDLGGGKEIPEERTRTNVMALRNFFSVLRVAEHTINTSYKQELESDLVTLLGIVVSDRPDMTQDPKFPWDSVVHYAVFVPRDAGVPRHEARMSIIDHAPDDSVRKVLADFTAAGGDIFNTLTGEQPSLWEKEPYESPAYLRILELLPENLEGARSVVNFVAQQERTVIAIALENPKFNIPYEALDGLELNAAERWLGLSRNDQKQFLTTDLAYTLRRLYPERLKDNLTEYAKKTLAQLPRLNGLIPSIVAETSEKTTDAIAEQITLHLLGNPDLKLGILSDWFPEMAENIERRRPTGIGATISRFIFGSKN
jgi:hypothetical protein